MNSTISYRGRLGTFRFLAGRSALDGRSLARLLGSWEACGVSGRGASVGTAAAVAGGGSVVGGIDEDTGGLPSKSIFGTFSRIQL